MILRCDCVHRVQDTMHGDQNRVFNEAKGSPGTKKYRCTVCTKEQTKGSAPKKGKDV